MPRVTTVAKAQKSPGSCRECSTVIAVGEPYKWAKKRYGPRMVWCAKHSPKGSDLAGGRTAELMAISEALETGLGGSIEEIAGALESAADEAEGLAESLQEGADNIESGFNHETEQSSRMHESADSVREWAERLREAAEE